ncbi:MAG: WS/DGAT/MGAT family O-acyltransferase [Solirubrobacteraceae bacterium]
MRNPDRLTGIDSSFLHLEHDATHMHVAACAMFEGPAPAYEELVERIVSRLHLVPRYRQRLAFIPWQQGRPVWVDDPHFKVTYHVRHTALPRPGSDEKLRRLAGRVFSQALDRGRPLWELWLVEGLADDRFAVLSKTHHALVDGVSGVDVISVLLDSSPDPMPVEPAEEDWVPRPLPSATQLLARSLLERATVPGEIARGLRASVRAPRQLAAQIGNALAGVGALAWAGMSAAPASPFNVKIGPHRRFTWVRCDLAALKAVKDAVGGTINDAVLSVVAGALGGYMRLHGHETDGVELTVMVPVSVRAEPRRGTLGNQLAAMWAPLPVGMTDPVQRMRAITRAMEEVKDSGQAVGAEVLTQLSGFAPATLMAQAARLQARQKLFNLVVTNVPGPQFPLYLLGRELDSVFPMIPLAENTALGVAVMSYNGQLNFGLIADYDTLADLQSLADGLRYSIDELAAAAQASSGPRPPERARTGAPSRPGSRRPLRAAR